MFDISFTELMLVGVIALVVIGPERLPRVARTIGHLLGRAQRYVGDVKSDIQREMDIDQIDDLKGQMEEAAKSVKASVKDATDTLRDPLEDARKALKETTDSVDDLVKSTRKELDEISTTATSGSEKSAPQPDLTTAADPERTLTDTELADTRLAQSASHDVEPSTHDQKPGTPL